MECTLYQCTYIIQWLPKEVQTHTYTHQHLIYTYPPIYRTKYSGSTLVAACSCFNLTQTANKLLKWLTLTRNPLSIVVKGKIQSKLRGHLLLSLNGHCLLLLFLLLLSFGSWQTTFSALPSSAEGICPTAVIVEGHDRCTFLSKEWEHTFRNPQINYYWAHC